jgi:hypothetical protein
VSPPLQKRRGEEASFGRLLSWRRVNPRAASDGGALEHAPQAVPASNSCAEGFLCNFWSFEDCFVKFGLFDVVFIYF